jgi:hypothetical protein
MLVTNPGGAAMTKVAAGITTSLDGYITGPDDGPGRGLGEGGERLHYWAFGGPWSYAEEPGGAATGADKEFLDQGINRVGAVVGGRNTYEARPGCGHGCARRTASLVCGRCCSRAGTTIQRRRGPPVRSHEPRRWDPWFELACHGICISGARQLELTPRRPNDHSPVRRCPRRIPRRGGLEEAA